jgi:hypothetical protein
LEGQFLRKRGDDFLEDISELPEEEKVRKLITKVQQGSN